MFRLNLACNMCVYICVRVCINGIWTYILVASLSAFAQLRQLVLLPAEFYSKFIFSFRFNRFHIWRLYVIIYTSIISLTSRPCLFRVVKSPSLVANHIFSYVTTLRCIYILGRRRNAVQPSLRAEPSKFHYRRWCWSIDWEVNNIHR